jgi:hypothetical protein
VGFMAGILGSPGLVPEGRRGGVIAS